MKHPRIWIATIALVLTALSTALAGQGEGPDGESRMPFRLGLEVSLTFHPFDLAVTSRLSWGEALRAADTTPPRDGLRLPPGSPALLRAAGHAALGMMEVIL